MSLHTLLRDLGHALMQAGWFCGFRLYPATCWTDKLTSYSAYRDRAGGAGPAQAGYSGLPVRLITVGQPYLLLRSIFFFFFSRITVLADSDRWGARKFTIGPFTAPVWYHE